MFSIIICSIDDAKFNHAAEVYGRAFGDEPVEIFRVPDAKGLAEGYNRAVPHTHGERIIFSHDDVEILSADFKQRLLGHLEHADVVGVAGASRLINGKWTNSCPPYIFGQVASFDPNSNMYGVLIWGIPARRIGGIKALDGFFMCARREVVEAVPFDAETFDGFHGYDIDFSFRAHLSGFRLAVCCDLLLLHLSKGDWGDQWQQYELKFRQKHAAKLDRMPQRGFDVCAVSCFTPQELVELMTPAWPPEEPPLTPPSPPPRP